MAFQRSFFLEYISTPNVSWMSFQGPLWLSHPGTHLYRQIRQPTWWLRESRDYWVEQTRCTTIRWTVTHPESWLWAGYHPKTETSCSMDDTGLYLSAAVHYATAARFGFLFPLKCVTPNRHQMDVKIFEKLTHNGSRLVFIWPMSEMKLMTFFCF